MTTNNVTYDKAIEPIGMEDNMETNIKQTEIKYDNVFDEPDTARHDKVPYVVDGQVINLLEVVKKEPKTVDWKDGTSTLRTLLTFKDGTQLVIPVSLGWKISALRKEYGAKCTKVKVSIKGTGQTKNYDALLVL